MSQLCNSTLCNLNDKNHLVNKEIKDYEKKGRCSLSNMIRNISKINLMNLLKRSKGSHAPFFQLKKVHFIKTYIDKTGKMCYNYYIIRDKEIILWKKK